MKKTTTDANQIRSEDKEQKPSNTAALCTDAAMNIRCDYYSDEVCMVGAVKQEWLNFTYFSQISLELKKVMVELHLGSKKVFPQKYHAFDVVKRLENTHFLSHLGTGLELTILVIRFEHKIPCIVEDFISVVCVKILVSETCHRLRSNHAND
ncbi:Uncharacterized protein FWK35_00029816 [Aphis craccivora]|uniref:Uncharacterized protein n=2 Tax=Aphis craccivora TaxID=307492 RepID=A0A6G0VNI7_APHCR|nr:Uncharacterized protein FWK35_00029816 [Aphis craccivora]